MFRIIDKATGDPVGSYSRAYSDEYDFRSVDEARHANCHGMFESKGKYKIAKYRVTYTLLDPDCDGAEGVQEPPNPYEGMSFEEAWAQMIYDMFYGT